MITEPLGSRREVLVKPNHNSQTYAEVLAHIAENMYPDQDQITLNEDNLSAHRMAPHMKYSPPNAPGKLPGSFRWSERPPMAPGSISRSVNSAS